MASTDKLFAGQIPEIYDDLLVPLIFDVYAADLAGRIAEVAPQHIAEIAAGTGALTRAMAARLDAGTRIVASDLNPPMLDRAAARQPSGSQITWQKEDALALSFDDRSFDVVACQFGVMFFPDKTAGYREAYRALKPGGHYFFNVWGRISDNDFPYTVSKALEALFPDSPPRFMATTPHGYHDIETIRGELAAAGFEAVSIETLDRTSRAASAYDVAKAYCQGTPVRYEIEARAPTGLEAVTQACADSLARAFGSGPIEGRIRAHVVSAVR